jgi:PAS domain S-box-containing protein
MNQDLLEHLIKYSNDAILYLSDDFRIIDLNSAAEEVYGWHKKEILDKNYFILCQNSHIESIVTSDALKVLPYNVDKKIHQAIYYKDETERYIVWTIYSVLNYDKKWVIFFIGQDLSKEKLLEQQKETTEFYLDSVISQIPEYVFWKNKYSVYLGCNDLLARAAGLKSREEIVGKMDDDFGWDVKRVALLKEIDKEVITKGIPNTIEEVIPLPNSGLERIMVTHKVPLKNKKGDPVGILGISFDVTDRRKIEQLKLETEQQKAKITEQEKFAKVAAQVSHDMRSPLAGIISIMDGRALEFPEDLRISFRNGLINIKDIADYLLSYHKKNKMEEESKKQSVLIFLALSQLLSEKRYQYKDQLITFEYQPSANSNFVFIKIVPIALIRMLTNLINNAMDAFDGKPGNIILKLITDDKQAKIVIEDNGKGMPEDVLNKLRNNVAITSGKEKGHGIGMTQVMDTLKENDGEMQIESKVGKGTTITITFPVIPTPEWAVTEISFHKEDIIVILDDDPSIHSAWEIRFKEYEGVVTLNHFTFGEEAINFINTPGIDKNKILLLTDYELLNQEVNGLDVVERTQVPRSILVTSHFTKQEVHDGVIEAKIKILPKQLTPEVPLKIIEKQIEVKKTVDATNTASLKDIDIVVVEDYKTLADGFSMLLNKNGRKSDVYYDGNKFLKNFKQYSKNTDICLDYSLGDTTGVEIAKTLYEAGYTKLYLLTGWDKDSLEEYNIPSYLTVLLKTDMDAIIKKFAKN